jgi:hypothetical protein
MGSLGLLSGRYFFIITVQLRFNHQGIGELVLKKTVLMASKSTYVDNVTFSQQTILIFVSAHGSQVYSTLTHVDGQHIIIIWQISLCKVRKPFNEAQRQLDTCLRNFSAHSHTNTHVHSLSLSFPFSQAIRLHTQGFVSGKFWLLLKKG